MTTDEETYESEHELEKEEPPKPTTPAKPELEQVEEEEPAPKAQPTEPELPQEVKEEAAPQGEEGPPEVPPSPAIHNKYNKT